MNNPFIGFMRRRAKLLRFSRAVRPVFRSKSVSFKKLLVITGIVCMAAQSHAAVIAYDEANDGDLLELDLVGDGVFTAANATDIGTLGIGTNTVTGVTSWDRVNPADFDGFVFSVSPGTQLITGQIHFSFTGGFFSAGFTLFQNIAPDLYRFIGNPYLDSNISELNLYVNSPHDFFSDFADINLPLTAGNYAMYPMYVGAEIPGGAMSYTWELEVTAVPLPSSLYLFASGFAAMAGFFRRRSGLVDRGRRR